MDPDSIRPVTIFASAPALALALSSIAASKSTQTPAATAPLRQRMLLDADWRFHRRDLSSSNEVLSAGFDDRPWQRVDLPHDYVLDGTYARTNDEKHGYLPLEVGWYRKRLFISESQSARILRLDFDGAFRDSQVWLNGQLLGRHPSGYTPFSFDISKVVTPGADNLIVVRVDPRQFEGHWYEGGGIYRHAMAA